MKHSIALFSAFLALTILPFSHAATPPAQIIKTGQTTCFLNSGSSVVPGPCSGTGQDGELQAGLPWPESRFHDNGDGTITDTMTGLMWLKDANDLATRYPSLDDEMWVPNFKLGNLNILGDGAVSYNRAQSYLALLNAAPGHLGYTDWRLPNANELQSLAHLGVTSPSGWLAAQGFVNVQNGMYQSSTQFFPNGIPIAVAIGTLDFSVSSLTSLISAIDMGSMCFVWPVRTARTVAPAVPAQAAGSTSGVAWPNPRFVVQGAVGSEIYTDNLTGLSWPKNSVYPGSPAPCPSGTQNFFDALTYVNCLNSKGYLGFTDWRLPNVREFVSIVYPDYSSGLPPANPLSSISAPIFSPYAGSYWTSDTILYAGAGGNFYSFTGYPILYSSTNMKMMPIAALPVRGATLVPVVIATPALKNFVSPATQPFSLASSGTGDLVLDMNSATISGPAAGDFAITASSCTGVVTIPPAGTPCSIGVTFTPKSSGERQAQLTLYTNAPAMPVLTIPLFSQDTTPPAVVATVPARTATNVMLPTEIRMTFSEAIDPATLTGKISVSGLTGNVIYDPVSFSTTYIPDTPLLNNTTYTVTIAAGITDLAGNASTADSFVFLTSYDSGKFVKFTKGTPPVVQPSSLTLVSQAYNNIEAANQKILAVGTVINEPAPPVTFNKAYAVSLIGGYNYNFSAVTGQTTLRGGLVISKGSVIISDIVIAP